MSGLSLTPRPPSAQRKGPRPPSRGRAATPDSGFKRGPQPDSPTDHSTRAPSPFSRGRTPDPHRGRSPSPTEPGVEGKFQRGPRSPRSQSPPQGPLNGFEAFARLTRSTERGEQASVSLISTCIDFVLSGEIDDLGLLMRMLPNVLEASNGKLSDIDSSCQELTREVAKLRERIRQQNLDLEAGEAEVARAENENQDTAVRTDRLRIEGVQSIEILRRELGQAESEVELLRARLADDLKDDRQAWETERGSLQQDVARLQKELADAEAPLKEYNDAEKKAKENLVTMKAQLKTVMKEATDAAEWRHKLDKKNDEVNAHRVKLQELEAKMQKKKKKKGGKKK